MFNWDVKVNIKSNMIPFTALNFKSTIGQTFTTFYSHWIPSFNQKMSDYRLMLTKYCLCHTCPVEVRARDDWLPAQTLRINIPWSASTTLGLYTRLVSPWPSLPAQKHQEKYKAKVIKLPQIWATLHQNLLKVDKADEVIQTSIHSNRVTPMHISSVTINHEFLYTLSFLINYG